MSKSKFKHTTKRKSGGDDKYSWAVYWKWSGRQFVNGCSISQATYYQGVAEKMEEERLNKEHK